VLFGSAVSKTLSGGIIPADIVTTKTVLIILVAATLSLFVANMMHIPQSTSLSTIAAIGGVGLFHNEINLAKIQFLVICWVAATVGSFVLIFLAARYVYPPRKGNFWIYERVVHHTERLKVIVNATSFYKAFAQGSNNVANAVGPLVAAGLIGTQPGLLLMGVMFGLGAFVFSGPLATSSEKIVPLGLLTATVINVISGTITIIASKFGVPLPTVIVYTVAIFAIGSIKDGVGMTWGNPVTKRTLFTWGVNPIITLGVSYGLCWLLLSKG
jgi:sulfate permease